MDHLMIKKLLAATAIGVAAVMLTAGSTWAFECYNASRSDNGNAHAANGKALSSLEEVLGPDLFGLCPAGIDHVIGGLEAEGFDTSIVINFRALMAGGLEKSEKGEAKLHDGQGIDHLSDEFFEVADGLIGDAFGICGGA